MTERTGSDRFRVGRNRRLYDALMTKGGRFRLIVVTLLILGVTIGGHIYGRDLASQDILHRDNTIGQLQSEGQKLKRDITEQNAKFATLQAKLTSVQAALDAIMPSENTYNFSPNQSLIVAGGHLTVGLVGSPANQGINVNINGKQHSAAAGDVIRIVLDPSTTCQVAVQSFDMFKAVLTASCAETKPQ